MRTYVDGVDVDEFVKKEAKGRRYATEPDRFTLQGAQFSMASEHGRRSLRLADGEWRCSCEFFGRAGNCSHLMALNALLGELGISVELGDGAGGDDHA